MNRLKIFVFILGRFTDNHNKLLWFYCEWDVDLMWTKGGGISPGIENTTDRHYKKRLYIQQDSVGMGERFRIRCGWKWLNKKMQWNVQNGSLIYRYYLLRPEFQMYPALLITVQTVMSIRFFNALNSVFLCIF